MSLCARIVEQIAKGLARTEHSLRLEQAVVGLDMLDELRLQRIVASALGEAGWGVLREVPYPTPPRRNAIRSERHRCDFVLTPEPAQRVLDAVEAARIMDEMRATLFADLAPSPCAGRSVVDPRDATWIELKTTGQFTCRDGVGGPNRAFSSELVRGPAIDIRKLAADARIERGLAIVIFFATDGQTARHGFFEAVHRILNAGVPVVSTEFSLLPIADRIGNSVCAIAGMGLRHQQATG